MMKKLTISRLALAVVSAAVFSAQAQTTPAKPQYEIGGGKSDPEGPRGMSLAEGVSLYPYAKLSLGKDDNLYLSNANKKESNFALLNAGATLEAKRQNQTYTFAVDGTMGNYFDSSDDNYRDLLVSGAADFVLGPRAGLRLGLTYDKGHDPRGSTDRGFAGSPDVYRDTGYDVLYAYGANEARGRIEVAFGSSEKRYQNNSETTAFSNRNTDNFRGTAFIRVAPKTSLLAEYRRSRSDYLAATSQLDSTESRALLGVTWEATAATSGTIKAGRLQKSFKSGALSSFSGSSWEGGIEWKPLTYSKVDFFSNKSISESSGQGDFILTKTSGAAWTHDWNSRISTVVGYNYKQDDYQGAGATRKDETDTFSLGVKYKLGRSLTLGADYSRTDRDSNQSAFVYKRDQIMVTLGAAL